jgi:hypothetical protein
MPEGLERSKRTCGDLVDLELKAIAARLKLPPGVDAAKWDEISAEMREIFSKLQGDCQVRPVDDHEELPKLYASYQRLVELLPATQGGADTASVIVGPVSASTVRSIPPSFLALEGVLLPLLREPEGEQRSRNVCKHIMQIQIKYLAARREMPQGVIAAEWESASNQIRGGLEGLGPICTDDPPNDSAELPGLYLGYLRLVELLPR